MATLSLKRAGKFHARRMINTAQKCGAMSNRSYNYSVHIDASDHKLSPEGYVLNNEYVQEYFDNRYGVNAKPWHAISCERIALQSAKELAFLVSRSAEPLHVSCTIEGSNGALITATWKQGEEFGLLLRPTESETIANPIDHRETIMPGSGEPIPAQE